MNWYRIKTVLIFLFLGINIFLAALLGIGTLSETRAEQERVSAASALLRENGITVLAEVPHKTARLGTLTLQNPKADAETFAARILGGKATRLGEAWRRDGKTVTFLDRGFAYDSGAAAVPAEKKNIKEMKAALADMGFSMQYAEGALEEGAVIFTQTVDGAQLFNCALAVYPAADGSVARMEGNWAEITESGMEKVRVRSAADALLSFLREGEPDSTITFVTCGYAVLLTDLGYRTADAVPVWRVETGDGNVHYFDAR